MNQDELRAEILTEFKQVHKLAPADYTENCTNVVMSLIRTEKLKLLDRLESKAFYDPSGTSPLINPREIQAERNKLEAEL